jgi:hypothetical protein
MSKKNTSFFLFKKNPLVLLFVFLGPLQDEHPSLNLASHVCVAKLKLGHFFTFLFYFYKFL